MKTLFSLFIFINMCTCFAQSNSHNGQMISTNNVQFPSYENVEGISFYYSKPAYEKAISNHRLKIEKLYYRSEGLKVTAYLAHPQEINNQKLPVIVFNRGSVIRNDIAIVHAPLFEKFVDSGFIVLAPALRQSEGSEGKDEVGGKDVDDIINTIPLLSSLPYADTARIYMYGESRGGMMTLQAIRENYPLKAAAIVGAFTDLELFIKDTPGMETFANSYGRITRKIKKSYSNDGLLFIGLIKLIHPY